MLLDAYTFMMSIHNSIILIDLGAHRLILAKVNCSELISNTVLSSYGNHRRQEKRQQMNSTNDTFIPALFKKNFPVGVIEESFAFGACGRPGLC